MENSVKARISFIAEIGINHNGSLDIAKELILGAKVAGADFVKFQKRNPEVCVPEDQKHIVKDTVFGEMEYIEYKRLIEFGKEEYDEIDRYCKEIGIKWTASIWDVDSLNFLLEYDIPFIKIPSACNLNKNIIEELKRRKDEINNRGIFIVISNGMVTNDQFDETVEELSDFNLVLMECNSAYPSNNSDLNLVNIKYLREKYPYKNLGYSEHEEGMLPTIVGASLGVNMIERHITLHKGMKGSDHKASLTLSEFQEMVENVKEVEKILGSCKTVCEKEQAMIKKLQSK